MIKGFRKFENIDPLVWLSERTVVTEYGCHLFIGRLNEGGYGVINKSELMRTYNVRFSHQLSYVLYNGEYKRGLDIRHTCHVRNCVNPSHLLTGTRYDNIQDMEKAGRAIHVTGERHGRCKLSDKDIVFIRNTLNNPLTAKDLANIFNISLGYVYHIKNGYRRKDSI